MRIDDIAERLRGLRIPIRVVEAPVNSERLKAAEERAWAAETRFWTVLGKLDKTDQDWEEIEKAKKHASVVSRLSIPRKLDIAGVQIPWLSKNWHPSWYRDR